MDAKVFSAELRGKAEIPGVVPGKNGESAYEIAVKNGFDGTEEEWLASLKGEGIPPINAEDEDKVLTANADGTASWKTPTGGNGGNANFIFADSVEELPDPATVPEDTVGLVPSEEKESDSGLPKVTTEDEGKFLRVVDGAYALVALTDVSVEGA